MLHCATFTVSREEIRLSATFSWRDKATPLQRAQMKSCGASRWNTESRHYFNAEFANLQSIMSALAFLRAALGIKQSAGSAGAGDSPCSGRWLTAAALD
jgi:hypothetical protein